jgi:antirestriction protein ArdC
MDAVVRQIGELLSRSHSLFAGPGPSGAPTAAGSGARLADAGQRVQAGGDRIAQLAGRMSDGHASFSGSASTELSALAGCDAQLSRHLERATENHQRGNAASTAVIGAATVDTTALGLLTRTSAGQHAVLSALRAQLAEQQRIIADTRADAAATAAAIRALTYPPATSGPTIGAAQ